MKPVLLFIPLIFISSLLAAQFVECNSPTAHHLKDVWFIDETIGLAVGDSGTIIRSTDGGDHWIGVLSNDSVSFIKVKFFNAMNGLAMGSHIFVTHDAGLTWSYTPFLNNQFYDIEILNETTCILSGEPTALIKSTDQGASFTILIEEQNINSEFGLLSFVDENTGYACSYWGGISTRTLKTMDGGNQWQAIEDTSSSINPTVMEAMSFVSENVGFKGGWYNSHLQKTTDGAGHWQDVTFTNLTAYHQLLDFHIRPGQPNAYYSCGWYGQIFKSTDGGNTWVELNSGLSNTTSLNGIFFINDSLGWAVGNYGTIIKTSNGGGLLGVAETVDGPGLDIYPSPTDGILFIENKSSFKMLSIEVMSVSGQVLQSFKPGEPISLKPFPGGTYLLRIVTDQGIRIEKVLKR